MSDADPSTSPAPPRDERTLDREGVRQATLAGVSWIATTRVAGELITLASTVVLARLLEPAEFGRAVIAFVIADIASALAVSGLGNALVQRKEISDAYLQAASLVAIVQGVVFTALTFWLAPVVVGPTFGDRTAVLMQIVSPVFFVGGLTIVRGAILERQMDFRRITVIGTAQFLLGTVATISMAALGLGDLALALGAMSGVTLGLIVLLSTTPAPPRPAWHRAEVIEVLRFGLPNVGNSLLFTATRTVDTALVAARLGPAAAGVYARAFSFGSDYQSKVSGVLTQLTLPVLSRSRDMDDLRGLRSRMQRTQVTLIFPLLTLLIALAPTFVPFFLGPGWEAAVVPTQILTGAGFVASVGTGTGPLLVAVGRPGALLTYSLCAFVVFAVAVAIGSQWDILGVCIAAIVAKVVSLLCLQYFLVQRIVGISLRDTLGRDLAPAAVCCLPVIAFAYPAARALENAGLPSLAILLPVAAVGLAIYAVTLRLLFPATFTDVGLLVQRLLPTRFRKVTV